MQNQDNILNPVRLTTPEHVARYNALSSKFVVATRHFDEDLLTTFGFVDDIR